MGLHTAMPPGAAAARDAVPPLSARVATLESELAHLVRQITGEAPRPPLTPWIGLRARRRERETELQQARQAQVAAERIAAAWAVSQALGPLVERYETLRLRAAALVCEEGEERVTVAREMQGLQLRIDEISARARPGDTA